MIRTLLFAYAVAIALAGAMFGTWLIHTRWFCENDEPRVRARVAAGALPHPDRYAVATPGERIYACTFLHCAPAAGCHKDLACHCVSPAAARDESALAGRLEASGSGAPHCVLDKDHPSRDDTAGLCPRARCYSHIDP